MAIVRIKTPQGNKLKDTVSGKMVGAEGLGKTPATPINYSQTVKDSESNEVKTRKRWKDPLSITHPEYASQAYGWDPSVFTAGSKQQLEWQCATCSTKWTVSPGERVTGRKGRYCPTCPRMVGAMPGSVSLAEAFPDIASEAYGWDPRYETSGSGKNQQWKCPTCSCIYPATIKNRTDLGSGCPDCAGKYSEDITVTHPELAKEASGWDPHQYTAGSNVKLQWKCSSCSYKWPATCQERIKYPRRWGCSPCNKYAGQYQIVFGQNSRISEPEESLLVKYPELVGELVDPSIADTLSYAAGIRVPWKCGECGHTWNATPKSRTLHGTGCSECAATGFKKDIPAFLYFVQGERNGQVITQYGITNNLQQRLRYHRRNGFSPEGTSEFLQFDQGGDAAALESRIKIALAMRGIDSIKTDESLDDNFQGYTESFRQEILPVASLRDLLDNLSLPIPEVGRWKAPLSG
jgi:predicted  nucleic acid-binding Zn-ribbon protein